MRRVALGAVLLLIAFGANAADPIYLDELMETPLAKLQATFPQLTKEGCYRVAENRYVLITIEKKDQKPWRVVLASEPPCRRFETGPAIDVRERAGVELGESQIEVVKKMGSPEMSAQADKDNKRFGDWEFFYICKVSADCARHTSIYIRNGNVTAIAEWYSQ